jgi:hypothetical protein
VKVLPINSFGFKWSTPIVEIINNSKYDLSTRKLAVEFLRANRIQLGQNVRSLTIEDKTVTIENKDGTFKEVKL